MNQLVENIVAASHAIYRNENDCWDKFDAAIKAVEAALSHPSPIQPESIPMSGRGLKDLSPEAHDKLQQVCLRYRDDMRSYRAEQAQLQAQVRDTPLSAPAHPETGERAALVDKLKRFYASTPVWAEEDRKVLEEAIAALSASPAPEEVALPELPEPVRRDFVTLGSWDDEPIYTADQMRAYGQLCRSKP